MMMSTGLQLVNQTRHGYPPIIIISENVITIVSKGNIAANNPSEIKGKR